jgi:hypothetical protein
MVLLTQGAIRPREVMDELGRYNTANVQAATMRELEGGTLDVRGALSRLATAAFHHDGTVEPRDAFLPRHPTRLLLPREVDGTAGEESKADRLHLLPPEAVDRAAVEAAVEAAPPDALVDVERCADGVALVSLRDTHNRNMLSPSLVACLHQAMAALASDPGIRAIVVHGHAGWFCAGGTLEVVSLVRQGRLDCTTGDVVQLLLDCPLPTIAAMDGSALGAGLVFGLCADVVVMR